MIFLKKECENIYTKFKDSFYITIGVFLKKSIYAMEN